MAERLTAVQMAQFVAKGFLVFPGIVPEGLRAAVRADIDGDGLGDCGYRGERFADRYRGTALGEALRLPAVGAILDSLVGQDPIFDHHCRHLQPAHASGGGWHQDAVIDTKRHFDVQLMYFPHDTPAEMGGTMLLPGSHFRRVHVFEVGRYHNFLGQMPMVCPAGTLVATHHGIWHTARPNRTAQPRTMFKIRLAARIPQVRLFDQEGADGDEVRGILDRQEPWMDSDGRLDVMHRIRLWRLLTGDPGFDVSYWLGRLENDPATAVPRAARRWRTPSSEAAVAAATAGAHP